MDKSSPPFAATTAATVSAPPSGIPAECAGDDISGALSDILNSEALADATVADDAKSLLSALSALPRGGAEPSQLMATLASALELSQRAGIDIQKLLASNSELPAEAASVIKALTGSAPDSSAISSAVSALDISETLNSLFASEGDSDTK